MKAKLTPRLEVEVPWILERRGEADRGGEVENRSRFHGSWFVKGTDAMRRQRRLLAARGHEATLDGAGVPEPDALRAPGSWIPNHGRGEASRCQQAQGGAGAEHAVVGSEGSREGEQCLSQ